jgi:hypothetical protein
LLTRARAGYRTAVERMPGDARPLVRIVIAPADWRLWRSLPAFE